MCVSLFFSARCSFHFMLSFRLEHFFFLFSIKMLHSNNGPTIFSFAFCLLFSRIHLTDNYFPISLLIIITSKCIFVFNAFAFGICRQSYITILCDPTHTHTRNAQKLSASKLKTTWTTIKTKESEKKLFF